MKLQSKTCFVFYYEGRKLSLANAAHVCLFHQQIDNTCYGVI